MRHPMQCTALALLLLAAASCARTQERSDPISARGFTQYGYDLDNTQRNDSERRIDSHNVARLHELWRMNVTDGATSVPVVADGKVYFGSWNGHFYALDATSGEIAWERRLTPRWIRSTAFIDADRIYVAAGEKLVALDRERGDVRFERALDSQLTALLDASPKVIDGLVLLGLASFENTVPVDDYTATGALIAIDAHSGEEIWRVSTTGNADGPCTGGAGASVWSTAAIDSALGLAYVGTGQSFEEPPSTCNDSLLAIHYARDYAGERIAWKQTYKQHDIYTAGMQVNGTDADVGTSPNLFRIAGRRVVGAGDKGGSYRVFDRVSGEPIWRRTFEVGPPPVSTGLGGVMTTAAVSGDTLFLASNVFRAGGFLATGEHDPSDTSVLHALDQASGEDRWNVTLPAPMVGGMTIANGMLFHATIDGQLYARELSTGRELWHVALNANVGAAPSVVDGQLYVSAGMVISGGFQDPRGAFVASYGLTDQQPVARQAPPEAITPLAPSECQMLVRPELASAPGCTECLCACDATSAGHCDVCLTLASCTVAACTQAQPGDPMRACIADACGTKLLPTFLFDRAVDLAPCLIHCASQCGFDMP